MLRTVSPPAILVKSVRPALHFYAEEELIQLVVASHLMFSVKQIKC